MGDYCRGMWGPFLSALAGAVVGALLAMLGQLLADRRAAERETAAFERQRHQRWQEFEREQLELLTKGLRSLRPRAVLSTSAEYRADLRHELGVLLFAVEFLDPDVQPLIRRTITEYRLALEPEAPRNLQAYLALHDLGSKALTALHRSFSRRYRSEVK